LQADAYSSRTSRRSLQLEVKEFYDSALSRVKNPELRKVVQRIAGKRRF